MTRGKDNYEKLMKETPRPGKEIDVGPLTMEEMRLIKSLRTIPWGEARVIMKYGKPAMLKRQVEDVKLTD